MLNTIDYRIFSEFSQYNIVIFQNNKKKGDVSLLYNKIKQLAKKKGIPIYKVESDCGYESGAMCRWNESSPNAKRLKIVADYLGVTVDELLEE